MPDNDASREARDKGTAFLGPGREAGGVENP
jgi:hypothetical protein